MDTGAETTVKIVNFDEDLNPHVETTSHLVSDSSEYTEHFLSQLTADPLVLSSHQVSSVLSELEPNRLTSSCSASPAISTDVLPLPKSALPPVNLQTLLEEKRQSPSPSSPIALPSLDIPLVVPEKRYHAIKCAKVTLGHLSWYRCSACPFLASEQHLITTHFMNLHVDSVAAALRCLNCEINFSRLQNLKHHYVVDHLVALSDLQTLIKMTIEANRCWSEKNKKGKPDDCSMVDSIIPEIITAEENLIEESLLFHTEPPEEVATLAQPQPIIEVPLTDTHPMLTFILNKFPPESSTNESDVVAVNSEDKRVDKLREEEAKKAEMKAEKEEKAIWKCPVVGCSLKFTSEDNLSYHKMCHEVGTGQWKCPECSNTFVKWPELSIHLWRNHEIDIDLYACDLCDFKANNLSKLMKLHRRIHGNDRPYLCDICGKGFKTTKQLGTHKGVHFKSRKPAFTNSATCFICSRKFADIRLLRHHVDIVHRGLRPYVCHLCNHSASSMSSLKMHLRSHTGEKPYSCPICRYKTADHNSLRRHKMRHSGVKHYKCPYCSYASIQSSTYKDHLKKKHPGQDGGLLFCCNHCSFRTVNDKIFLTHLSSHSASAAEKNQVEVAQVEQVITDPAEG